MNHRRPTLVLRVGAAALAIAALAACNDSGSSDCPGGTIVQDGDRAFCVLPRLITETGFLCPEAYPEGYGAGEATVCAEAGDDPEESAAALCEALGLDFDADENVCRASDGDAIPFEPAEPAAPGDDTGVPDASAPDAGASDAGGVDPDASTPDASDPDAGDASSDASVPDVGPGDASVVDADPEPDALGPDAAPDAAPDADGPDAGAPDADAGGPDVVDPLRCDSVSRECPEGLLCVQSDPLECAAEWTGRCERIDPDAICAEVLVCGCDGEPLGTACDAREAGYGEAFGECGVSSECVDDASSCQEGCFEMLAFAYDAELGCVEYAAGAQVVGCTSDEGGTDDAPCVRRVRDGALFIATSGSPFFTESWAFCDEETSARVQAADACPD